LTVRGPLPRALAALACLSLSAGVSAAQAQDIAAPDEDSADETRPWGGTVLLENAVGRGALTTLPEDRRPLWTLLVSVAPSFTLDEASALSVGLAFDASVNLVENADSSNTTPHQFQPGDLQLTANVGELVSLLDGGITLALDAYLAAPTSLYSRFAGKILSAHGGTAASWSPLSSLTIGASTGLTKHFYAGSTAVLDAADFDAPPLGRANGAETLADGRLAVSGNLTSFSVDYGGSVAWAPLESLEVACRLDFVSAWTSTAFPDDGFTSPNAEPGRGQADFMYGSLELSWSANDHLSLALGTVTEQAPKSVDNERLRFPFWDLTNGAANRQVVYLDLIGTL
jgi:hypothetical protein